MSDAGPAPERLWFLDTAVTIRIAERDGADGMSVLEHAAPHGDSPPRHIHRTEDEIFRVLEGEMRFLLGEEEHRRGPGDTFLVPKGVVHTFRVESAGGARWLTVTANGDFERFVRVLGRPAEGSGLPERAGAPTPEAIEALNALAAEHNIDIVGPPLH